MLQLGTREGIRGGTRGGTNGGTRGGTTAGTSRRGGRTGSLWDAYRRWGYVTGFVDSRCNSLAARAFDVGVDGARGPVDHALVGSIFNFPPPTPLYLTPAPIPSLSPPTPPPLTTSPDHFP